MQAVNLIDLPAALYVRKNLIRCSISLQGPKLRKGHTSEVHTSTEQSSVLFWHLRNGEKKKGDHCYATSAISQ